MTPVGRSRLVYASAGLIVLVLIAYAPTLSSEFVRLDDYQYVVDNRLVREPSWTGVGRFFAEVRRPSTVEGYYQPLTMASLMLDTYLARVIDACVPGGQDLDPAFAYHLTNVLLHAAACVLLMFLVRATVGGGVAVPLLVALLFAVHPVQVESVSWISQRKTVLSTLLAVGCIVCYLKRGRGGGLGWLMASVLLYVASGLAKPTVMLLPLVLPLLDIWPLRRRGRWAATMLLEKMPFVVCMAPMAWLAWTSQAASSAQLMAPSLSSFGVLAKSAGLTCYNLMLYLGTIFWPMTLSPYRDLPADLSLGDPAILLSVIGSIGLIVVCLGAYRWSKPLFVGGVAFLIMLSPALGAVRFAETCVADRFVYLPGLFLLLPLAGVIGRIETRMPARVTLVRACVGLFAVPLLILMRPQQGVWRDSHALWAHIVTTAPNLAKGHAQFAAAEMEAGAFGSALRHARRAVEINPQNAGYQHVLGRALVRSGRANEAVGVIRQAITMGLGPIEPLARVSLAEALIATGDVAGARASCERAIAMGRGAVSTYAMLGDAALRFAGNCTAAAEYYRLALERKPDDVAVRWNLGTALVACGLNAEALDEYEQVITMYRRRGLPTAELEAAAEMTRRRLDQATSAPGER
ncbi:MAG: tetratricopeptide repeat protein [Phycisphaerae bacterium]|nr:tetratricopeptide repeat protein [Phycisphaerae bacterium]